MIRSNNLLYFIAGTIGALGILGFIVAFVFFIQHSSTQWTTTEKSRNEPTSGSSSSNRSSSSSNGGGSSETFNIKLRFPCYSELGCIESGTSKSPVCNGQFMNVVCAVKKKFEDPETYDFVKSQYKKQLKKEEKEEKNHPNKKHNFMIKLPSKKGKKKKKTTLPIPKYTPCAFTYGSDSTLYYVLFAKNPYNDYKNKGQTKFHKQNIPSHVQSKKEKDIIQFLESASGKTIPHNAQASGAVNVQDVQNRGKE